MKIGKQLRNPDSMQQECNKTTFITPYLDLYGFVTHCLVSWLWGRELAGMGDEMMTMHDHGTRRRTTATSATCEQNKNVVDFASNWFADIII